MAKLCPKLSDSQIKELKTKLKRPTDIVELKRVQTVLTLNNNEKIEKIEIFSQRESAGAYLEERQRSDNS